MNHDDFFEQIEPKWMISIGDTISDPDNSLTLYVFCLGVFLCAVAISPPDTGLLAIVILTAVLMIPAMIILAPSLLIGLFLAMVMEMLIRFILAILSALYRVIASIYRTLTGKPKRQRAYIATPKIPVQRAYIPPTETTQPTPSPSQCETSFWIKAAVIVAGISLLGE